MQVQAIVGFGAMVKGQLVSVQAGEVVEMPEGADWLQAGLVALLEASPPVETAEAPQAGVEQAVTRKRK